MKIKLFATSLSLRCPICGSKLYVDTQTESYVCWNIDCSLFKKPLYLEVNAKCVEEDNYESKQKQAKRKKK